MFEQAFRNIDDVLRKDAGCTSELDYTEQSSWLLFLKYLDALEQERAMAAELEGRKYDWLLKKKIPLGQLGRAQGPRRSHRPQPGHDRR